MDTDVWILGGYQSDFARNLTKEGLDFADLTREIVDATLAAAKIDAGGRLAAYCGSGVTAAITVAALAAMGYQAALFPGSWSQWSFDPANPVARGDD